MSLKVKSNGINFNVPMIEDLPTERLEEGLVCVVTDENRGGVFVYREANALVNNSGTIFNGWTRQYDGAVNVKWFGAKGDGITDDTVAIETAELYCRDTGEKLISTSGVYTITRQLNFKAPYIDMTEGTIYICDNFPTTIAIDYQARDSIMNGESFVKINIEGNRYNQTNEVIAFQVSKAVSARSDFTVIGHRCNTLLQVIGSVERCIFNVFGTDSNIVVIEDRDIALDSPDTNTYYLSAGHCNQFFIKKQSTTSYVHFNCQGQYNVLEDGTLEPSTVYPVEILEGRISTLSGEIRATTFGAIYINSSVVASYQGLHFNELSLQGIQGNTPAIYNKAYNSITGNVTLIDYYNKAFVSETLNNAKLLLSLLDSDYVGTHIILGNSSLVKASAGSFSVINKGLQAGSTLVELQRVGPTVLDISGSSIPLVINNTVASDQVTIYVNRDYITSKTAITTNGIRVDCTVRGLLGQTDIIAYTSPFRGLKCWNLNTNSMAFYNGSSWYAPTATILS